MDLLWMEIVLFTYLAWLKSTIIKYFPNCLLMHQKDCSCSQKNYCYTFLYFFSFLFAYHSCFGLLAIQQFIYIPYMVKHKHRAKGEKVLGFWFISSYFPIHNALSCSFSLMLPPLFLIPSHYLSNGIMSFRCPFFSHFSLIITLTTSFWHPTNFPFRLKTKESKTFL